LLTQGCQSGFSFARRIGPGNVGGWEFRASEESASYFWWLQDCIGNSRNWGVRKFDFGEVVVGSALTQ
jgi:hypothetical protein